MILLFYSLYLFLENFNCRIIRQKYFFWLRCWTLHLFNNYFNFFLLFLRRLFFRLLEILNNFFENLRSLFLCLFKLFLLAGNKALLFLNKFLLLLNLLFLKISVLFCLIKVSLYLFAYSNCFLFTFHQLVYTSVTSLNKRFLTCDFIHKRFDGFVLTDR